MNVKITGYYKLPNELEPQLIEFDKVFDISFMRRYTKYKTFAKFLSGGKFNITCQKDFEDLPELNRRVSGRVYERLVDSALALGIENGFIQEGGTAKESFVPLWDGTGL